jgi:DUF1680 family protein
MSKICGFVIDAKSIVLALQESGALSTAKKPTENKTFLSKLAYFQQHFIYFWQHLAAENMAYFSATKSRRK